MIWRAIWRLNAKNWNNWPVFFKNLAKKSVCPMNHRPPGQGYRPIYRPVPLKKKPKKEASWNPSPALCRKTGTRSTSRLKRNKLSALGIQKHRLSSHRAPKEPKKTARHQLRTAAGEAPILGLAYKCQPLTVKSSRLAMWLNQLGTARFKAYLANWQTAYTALLPGRRTCLKNICSGMMTRKNWPAFFRA